MSKQAVSERISGHEAMDSKNSIAALPQLNRSVGNDTENSKNETSGSSETPQKKHKREGFGEFLPEEKKDSSIEYGSEGLNSFAEQQDITSASVTTNSFTAQTTNSLLSNPAHSSILTPVNRIIDGIGPLILPLLGYTYDTQNHYFPYLKKAHGVMNFFGNEIGSEDERLYADDSIVGLSTAIAREIYNSARAQQAAGIRQQSFEQLQLPRQTTGVQQSSVSTSNNAILGEERPMLQPPTVVVDKQDSAPMERFQEARHNGLFKIHDIRMLQQASPEFVQQSSQKPPIAQPIEPQEKSFEFEGTELSKGTEAPLTTYMDDKRAQDITKHSSLNPTAKVLPYPRFAPNPAEYNSRQTSSEELQHGSALLQIEYPRTQLRPTAAAPVLKNDLLLAKTNGNNVSPLYPTGKSIPSAITTDYDPQQKQPPTYEATREHADLQYVRSLNAAPFAISKALPARWSEELASRVAAASSEYMGTFEVRKQSVSPVISADNENDVGVPYNGGHSHAHEAFIGDSGLMFTQSPTLHSTHLMSGSADIQLFPSASQKTMKYGSFGKGRAPDMSYEASFGIHRRRRRTN